ncbi:MAG: aminotransferase class III-fold pyridoxal phosphate-dependent enzyme [Betaproteobacteria bacterium]|nr:aminotransferase class III-fold pyridoxal phosphate-dependent enzyme [Betaproteobacteria bacterium]
MPESSNPPLQGGADVHELQRLLAGDVAHHLHPFTDPEDLRRRPPRMIVRGDGVRIWDAEGHEILDAMSGLWCVNLGYGRADLVQAAQAQMTRLPFYNTFFQTTTQPAAELAAELSAVAPAGMRRVFFTEGGSTANDTMVRLVRRYWDVRGQPRRKVLIARRNAYHGSTLAAASLGGMAEMHAQGDLPLPGFSHIEQPHFLELGYPGESETAFGLRAAGWLEQRIVELGADRVAAFVMEPVQGAGGVIVPPPGYAREIQRICRRHGVLLVSDEVICGFGRLGHWFGCQHEHIGIEPDLICFAKGVSSGYLPLGGVLVGARVCDALEAGAGEFAHGFTYSGHPVCCAVALANVRALRGEGIVERVREHTAPYLQRRFAELAAHPLAGDPCGLGMVAALVLWRDKRAREAFPPEARAGMRCRDACFDAGVVMRAVGPRMIIAPPLVCSDADIDEMVRRIRCALDATLQGLRADGWL